MPGGSSEPPSVSLSFANNFWGKEDAGVSPLLERMHSAKTTSDELKAFYTARAAIEDEYARKLLNLARKPLGSSEAGTLRMSLDVVRAEIEGIGKAHQNVAQQMKTELDEQLAAFAGAMKERRKIVQGGVEKLLKVKMQQTMAVNKARDRYEQDCLKIKGYLAQGHMVMGQEERKNKAKLEKTQLQLSSTNNEYEAAVKVLEDTTVRWNRDWKAACDKFQDLEEERIDFTKSSLWSFANVSSTVCVSDDAACEKIRLSLEDCDVEKDIGSFIKECGTGQEIPDPPKYVNFCRGDGDTASEASEDGNYSVAQFQRTMNPAYRTSSPQPSTFESHNDSERDVTLDFRNSERSDVSTHTTPKKPQTDQQQSLQSSRPPSRHQETCNPSHKDGFSETPPANYSADGIVQFGRLDTASEISSAASPVRPGSRDSQSEYSNPTSFSSVDPGSVLSQSPTKQLSDLGSQPEAAQQVARKRSGFFQNHSPFRRKSKSEKESPRKGAAPSNRSTWGPSSVTSASRPHYGQGAMELSHANGRVSPSLEPVDPRANFQLNVGNNVFDVASPDSRKQSPQKQQLDDDEADPVARALAELKGVTNQSSVRQSADRYAGLATPAPGAGSMRPTPQAQKLADRSVPPPSYDGAISRLGAPQPAFTSRQMQQTTRQYTEQKQNMFNSPSRQSTHASPSTTQQASQRTAPQSRPTTQNHPSTAPVSRATSPSPYRSTSPRPGLYNDQGRAFGPPSRATSPSPTYAPTQDRPRAHSTSPVKQQSQPTAFRAGMGNAAAEYGGQGNPYSNSRMGMPMSRSVSPQPEMGGMQMQLAQPVQQQQHHQPQQGGGYGSAQRGRGNGAGMPMQARPTSMYSGGQGGGGAPQQQFQGQGQGQGQPVERMRSRSQAAMNEGKQFSREGRPVLHFSRAMYNYTASIPEELPFNKGDVLAVLRHQDDGWWEAELVGKRIRPGLVPSNYLQTT